MFRKSARKREEPSLRRSVVGLLRSNLSKVERIQYSPSTTPDSTPFYGPRRRIRIHSMSALSRNVLSRRAGLAVNPTASPAFSYGRTAAYRRLSQVQNGSVSRESSLLTTLSAPSALRSQFLPATISSSSRTFSSFAPYLQQQKQPEDVKDPPRPEQKASSEEPGSEEKAKEAEGEEKAEGEGEGPKEKKKAAPPPPKHGDKTPWQVFRDTLQQEFKASKEWNEGTKELQGSLHDFTQNPNVQKAKSAYTKATDAATSTTTAALKTTAGAIGSGAAWTWDTSVMKGVRKGARVVGTGLDKATKPLRETEAYKDVKNVIDDGSSMRYGGWVEKEERRKRREQKEAEEALKSGRPRSTEPMEEDPNAGTNITLHKDAKWKESWREFRDSSKLMQRLFDMKSVYNESENPLISTARSISDRVAGFFAENETAVVIKKFREMDPGFQLEPFLQEMREYILPEVLDAYVKGDVEVLKLWLSAAQFQVYAALMHQYTQHGLKSDGRILDIRNVDILNARMLEPGDIPVFVIMCRTQEVHVYRNKKTGQLASGMEDKVQQVTYAIGVTRVPEDVNNPETRGWRLIELQKSGRDYI
ncbi:protein translocase subunit [Zalaria obscura]|uniref:Protein translocase subunit n=1 Tax=Zalaria obscura TaxID=2024903 RepID=A0ACC3S5M6_9PEZI